MKHYFLVVSRAFHDALFLIMGVAHIEFDVLVSATDVGVILTLHTGASENLILPVASLNRLPDVEVVVIAIRLVAQLILIVSIVVRVKHLDFLSEFLPSDGSVEIHLHITLRTALGGNDDHTVGTTGTIDGS